MTKTYLQLAREIATLQAAADKQLMAEKREAVARLNETIAKYELSAADLKFPLAKAPGAASLTQSRPVNTATDPVTAKYSDGKGNSWGGRGPRPAWLRTALLAGKSLDSFTGSVSIAPAKPASPAHKEAGSSPKAGFTVKPKYRHPGTGETWSGRGSAPRWLKEALRKRGTKIDDFLIASQTTDVSPKRATKAAKPVAASKPKAVSKKAVRKTAAPATKSKGKSVSTAKATGSTGSAAKPSKGSTSAVSTAKTSRGKSPSKPSSAKPVVTQTTRPTAKPRRAAAAPQSPAKGAEPVAKKPTRKSALPAKPRAVKPAPAMEVAVTSTGEGSGASAPSETSASPTSA